MSESEKRIIVHYTDDIVAFSSAVIDAEKITGKITPYIPAKPTYAEPEDEQQVTAIQIISTVKHFSVRSMYMPISPGPTGFDNGKITKDADGQIQHL